MTSVNSKSKTCLACGNEFIPFRGKFETQKTCSRSCAIHMRRQNGWHSGYTPRSLAERFWPKVKKTSHCWLWIGSIGPHGYGTIWGSENNKDSKYSRAHRISWELHFGTIPSGMFVLHACDNRSCVNPDHLFLGDHTINMEDMAKKGRSQIGERHHNAKLNEELVRKIKLDNRSTPQIAADYYVNKSTISAIKTGKLWKHVI